MAAKGGLFGLRFEPNGAIQCGRVLQGSKRVHLQICCTIIGENWCGIERGGGQSLEEGRSLEGGRSRRRGRSPEVGRSQRRGRSPGVGRSQGKRGTTGDKVEAGVEREIGNFKIKFLILLLFLTCSCEKQERL